MDIRNTIDAANNLSSDLSVSLGDEGGNRPPIDETEGVGKHVAVEPRDSIGDKKSAQPPRKDHAGVYDGVSTDVRFGKEVMESIILTHLEQKEAAVSDKPRSCDGRSDKEKEEEDAAQTQSPDTTSNCRKSLYPFLPPAACDEDDNKTTDAIRKNPHSAFPEKEKLQNKPSTFLPSSILPSSATARRKERADKEEKGISDNYFLHNDVVMKTETAEASKPVPANKLQDISRLVETFDEPPLTIPKKYPTTKSNKNSDYGGERSDDVQKPATMVTRMGACFVNQPSQQEATITSQPGAFAVKSNVSWADEEKVTVLSEEEEEAKMQEGTGVSKCSSQEDEKGEDDQEVDSGPPLFPAMGGENVATSNRASTSNSTFLSSSTIAPNFSSQQPVVAVTVNPGEEESDQVARVEERLMRMWQSFLRNMPIVEGRQVVDQSNHNNGDNGSESSDSSVAVDGHDKEDPPPPTPRLFIQRLRERRRVVVVILILTAVLVVAVVVPTVIMTGKKSDDTSSSVSPPMTQEGTTISSPSSSEQPLTSSPTTSLTTSPTPSPTTERFMSIKSALQAVYDDSGALSDITSAQYQALVWIADEDEEHIEPNNQVERLVQRYALATLYFSTGGETWTKDCNFLTAGHECEWQKVNELNSTYCGVTCESGSYVIDDVQLGLANLTGTIPPEIALLSRLRYLNLKFNSLSGNIPEAVYGLSIMRYFYLHGNALTGTISSSIANFSDAYHVWLTDNMLTGTIPQSIGFLTNAIDLDLGENYLTGTLPASLNQLTNMKVLYIQTTEINGTLPFDGNPKKLEILALDQNQLSGSIPTSMTLLSSLQQLSLRDNEIQGSIPPFTANPRNMAYLNLGMNNFSGLIPPQLGNLTQLTSLILDMNSLSGIVPESFSQLTSLESFFIDGNNLIGDLSFICDVNPSIDKFYADCLGPNAEIVCPCCTCCDEHGFCVGPQG